MVEVRGIILHGTRSGRADNPDEGVGTVSYCTTPGTTSYNYVIDYDGTIYELVPPGVAAWHAGYLNWYWLGLAFAQPTVNDPITDAQHASARWLIDQLCQRYGIPKRRIAYLPYATADRGLVEHKDTAQGQAWGKSDVGPQLDWARLL